MNILKYIKNIKTHYPIVLHDDRVGNAEIINTNSYIIENNNGDFHICIQFLDLSIFKNCYINYEDSYRLSTSVNHKYFLITYLKENQYNHISNDKNISYKFYVIDANGDVINNSIYVKYAMDHTLLHIYNGDMSRTLCGTGKLGAVHLTDNIIQKNNSNDIYRDLVSLQSSKLSFSRIIGTATDISYFMKEMIDNMIIFNTDDVLKIEIRDNFMYKNDLDDIISTIHKYKINNVEITIAASINENGQICGNLDIY